MTDNKKDNLQNQQRATRTDRSFEPIADHFEKKVYGGLKGEIRLAVLRRDIFEYVETQSQNNTSAKEPIGKFLAIEISKTVRFATAYKILSREPFLTDGDVELFRF